LLVIISALGSLLTLVIPEYVIALLGLVPISIGVIRLIWIRKHESSIQEHMNEQVNYRWHNHLSTLTVAAVTFSNGGDNIGIYTPLFAKYTSAGEVVFLSILFMVMTAVWCVIAYYLVSHPLIARRIHRIGHILFPFVLIGIAIFIITSSFSQLIQ
jgi:cadmium resistance protein CadD (predicted permease)